MSRTRGPIRTAIKWIVGAAVVAVIVINLGLLAASILKSM